VDFENVVFIVDGGVGKNINATVPLRGIKQKYPDKKILVVASYPDIFQFNPNVDRVYSLGNPLYFYDDFIRDKKSLVLKNEPYLHHDYIYKNRHITDIWCEMLGVPFDNPKPDIFLTDVEYRDAREFINLQKKPVAIMQVTGGAPPKQGQLAPKMYVRNLPVEIANKVAEKLNTKHKVLLIKAPTQPTVDNTTPVSAPIRELIALIKYADKLVLIDSFMQHACAALEKQAVVVWGGTSPKVLGYESNINLTQSVCDEPFCHRPNSFLFDMPETGSVWKCRYGEKCMEYKHKSILDAVMK
jgi:ADP-heptose:LPS heptosyltransferase